MEFLLLLPVWYQYVLVTILGLIIGSFLNVVIYRFNTGVSINGSSHCLSCGQTLCWFELVPVMSYVVLRGHCRYCRSRIPSRYLWVELLTASLFALAYSQAEILGLLLLNWTLVSVLMVVFVYDIRHFIIPDRLVILLSLIAAAEYASSVSSPLALTSLTSPTLAAALAFSFYGGLWAYSRGRWIGFGDAKLVVPLGFLVGIAGVFSMIVLSFWVGAVISVAVLLYQRRQQGKTRMKNSGRKLTIKSEVPFAPFLIIAFLLVYFCSVDVLQIFMSI